MSVYVVQDTAKNISDAYRFLEKDEEPIFIFPPRAPFDLERCVRELRHKLRSYGDDDHLLLIGDPVVIGITMAVALEVNFGKAKVLRFDRQSNSYVPMQVRMHKKDEEARF